MEFGELIKKVWEAGFYDTGITTPRIVVAFGLSFAIGCFIFLIYQSVVHDGLYSMSFNVVLGAIAPIMAALVLTMQSSLIISLSSIGALSIIRFRTPIKDPMDLLFLFWSIGSGIMCGAGVYEVALAAAFFVAACILFLSYLPLRKGPGVLVVNLKDHLSEDAVLDIVKKYTRKYKVKSRNITGDGLDLVLELKVAKGKELLQELYGAEPVCSVSMIERGEELH